MALNIDVPSTILDLAGLLQPETWHGKSLMPIVRKQTKSLTRDTVLIEHIWEFKNIPPSEGVRTKDWKYFRYVNDKSFEELYNLKEDPQEIINLVADPAYLDKLKSFRNKCDELIDKNSDHYSNGPTNLMVAWIRSSQEVKILSRKPEYSWVISKRAVLQSAYQILVATSKEIIDNNNGNLWDSGQVKDNTSSNVKHKGGLLKEGETYFWKVRIWDKDNRLSRYSGSQSFKMGV